jgi:hypothetical protein
MACAFETTGAICMKVTPLIARIARNTTELSDITFKVAKEKSTNASRLSCKNGTLTRLP